MDNYKTLPEKIGDLFKSLRFWLLTFIALVMIAQVSGWISAEIFNVIKMWLIAVFGVGTLDSIATKIGGNK